MKQNQVIAKLQQNNNRQNEIITNIQENQKALKQGFSDLIEPYQREIIFRDELPKMIDEPTNMIEDKVSDKDADLIEVGDDELSEIFKSPDIQSSKKLKPKIINPDEGMSEGYKNFLDNTNLPLPSEIIVNKTDPKSILPKINKQIKKGKNSSQNNQQQRVSLINI